MSPAATPVLNPPPVPHTPGSAVPQSAPPTRYYLAQSTFRKFTLDEYNRLIETGVLKSGEPYELLEGNLVRKMSRGTPHDSVLDTLEGQFLLILSSDWFPRSQRAVSLAPSSPEPDLAIVHGPRGRYNKSHPGPADIGLVIEVADSSLLIDRHDKGSIYARANLPVYWVVNVVERVIEVYTQPAGTDEFAAYSQREVFSAGMSVPVVLDGASVGSIAVVDVMG